jgi:hypothetical protein
LVFTAVWLAFALDSAPCSVTALWPAAWNCPEPPDPIDGPPLGAIWVWLLAWLVLALLPAPLRATFAAPWLALLLPPEGSAPGGSAVALALEAFWSAFADEAASWPVMDFCPLS